MSSWDGEQYVPPVFKHDFFHNGTTFYVEVNGHRHGRLDSESLYNLLTYFKPRPLLTKAGSVAKSQPPPHKDSPGHFYYAQLKHYGLPPCKTKASAKRHLLAAFNPVTKTIEVPQYIIELERALEAEYNQAKIAAEKKQQQKRRREAAEEKKHKKQREEEDATLKEFADLGIVIRKGIIADLDEYASDDEGIVRVSDAQLRRIISALSESQLRRIVGNLAFHTPMLTTAIMKEIMAVSNAALTKGPEVKLLKDTQDNMAEYTITAPYLRWEWPDDTKKMVLKLSPSPKGSHLWGTFHFGIVSGIMRSRGGLPEKVGDAFNFLWRGHEEGEGEMTYGDYNFGTITFLGDGRIKGMMQWLGRFEFVGKRIPRDKPVSSRSVSNWKRKWRDINERTEEAERIARWNQGWYWEDDSEGYITPNSDTDGEEHDEGSEEDQDSYGSKKMVM